MKEQLLKQLREYNRSEIEASLSDMGIFAFSSTTNTECHRW